MPRVDVTSTRRTEGKRKEKFMVMYSEKTHGGKIVNVTNKAVVASVQEANFISLKVTCERNTSWC